MELGIAAYIYPATRYLYCISIIIITTKSVGWWPLAPLVLPEKVRSKGTHCPSCSSCELWGYHCHPNDHQQHHGHHHHHVDFHHHHHHYHHAKGSGWPCPSCASPSSANCYLPQLKCTQTTAMHCNTLHNNALQWNPLTLHCNTLHYNTLHCKMVHFAGPCFDALRGLSIDHPKPLWIITCTKNHAPFNFHYPTFSIVALFLSDGNISSHRCI